MNKNETNKNLLKSSFARLSPVAYYLRYFDDTFYMDFHTHKYLEFMYCVSGSFKVAIIDDGKILKNLIVNENEYIFLNTEKKHKLIIEKGTKPMIANIEFVILNDHEIAIEKCINYTQFFVSYLKDLYMNQDGYVLIRDHNLVKNTLISLITYLEENKEKDYIHQAMQILTFFFSINESLITDKKGDYSFIRKAIQYIYDNLNRPLSITEIANYVGKSDSYFAHIFKEDRGVSVLKYINNARIDKARFLLKNTSLSIADISKEVGFKDKNQLNYQFKAMINCTPSQYKKKVVLKTIDNRMVDNIYQSVDYKEI